MNIARCCPGSESAGVRGQLPSCRGLQGEGFMKTQQPRPTKAELAKCDEAQAHVDALYADGWLTDEQNHRLCNKIENAKHGTGRWGSYKDVEEVK